MSTLIRYLNKPEYLFQPRAIARRLLSRNAGRSVESVPLPWGISMEIDPRETIGRSLSKHGLFEIAVVEAMFRLVDPGELVLDIGANIGFMAAAAAASHTTVSVIAFEPHPGLFTRLSRNVDAWGVQRPDMRERVRARQVALSDVPGAATLHIPRAFNGNQGIASLIAGAATDGMTTVEVMCTTLDQVIAQEGRDVGLLKIDVEGHEPAAFRGAAHALASGRIRDIIFEDYRGLDSQVCRTLSEHGYSIYFLSKLPWRPLLCTSDQFAWAASISFDSPNYLATLDSARARSRMARSGFRCLARPQ